MPTEDRGFYRILGAAAALALVLVLLLLWGMYGCARKSEPASTPTTSLRPPAQSLNG